MMLYAITFITILTLERINKFSFIPVPFVRKFLALDFTYIFMSVFFRLSLAGLIQFLFLSSVWKLEPRTQINPAVAAVIIFALGDLAVYVTHRLLHSFRIGWEIHKAHHAILHLDGLTAFRRHFVEYIIYSASFLAFLYVFVVRLRWPVLSLDYAFTSLALFQIFNHSNIRINPSGFLVSKLSYLIYFPYSHRLHHMDPYAGKNFGNALSIWDQLLGTHQSADGSIQVAIGMPKGDDYPETFLAQQQYALKRLRRRRQ